MSLSRLLKEYAAGQDITLSVPLSETETEVWTFTTFASSGAWEKWEKELIESYAGTYGPPPEDDEHKKAHRGVEKAAGMVFPNDSDSFRQAFLAAKLIKSVVIETIEEDGTKSVKEMPAYKLGEWIQLANDTMLLKEVFDLINRSTNTIAQKSLQRIYDASKKNSTPITE